MSYQLNEINRRALEAPDSFVAECEARYEEEIIHAAQHIIEKSRESLERRQRINGPA